jgi:hypothetical protein
MARKVTLTGICFLVLLVLAPLEGRTEELVKKEKLQVFPDQT